MKLDAITVLILALAGIGAATALIILGHAVPTWIPAIVFGVLTGHFALQPPPKDGP